jgi:hypothetical protein
MFEKSLSHPINVYQSLVGAFGAVALFHSSTDSTFKLSQFQSTNVTLYHHLAYIFTIHSVAIPDPNIKSLNTNSLSSDNSY